jgi:hypothetical protein
MKLADAEEHLQKITVQEPFVSEFVHLLVSRIQARTPPVSLPRSRFRLEMVKKATKMRTKQFVLQFPDEFLKAIVLEPFHHTIQSMRKYLVAGDCNYPCLYIGHFEHRDNSPLSIRDICRLANILISKTKTQDAIEDMKMGELTQLAVTALGNYWKASLEEIGCWKTTSHEPEGEALFTDDLEPEQDDEESEGNEDPKATGPLNLRGTRFSEPFPFSPLYTGYTECPKTRLPRHNSSMPFPSILTWSPFDKVRIAPREDSTRS